MSRIIHFEIPAENPEICMDFYSKVFGWEFNQWGGQNYWLAKTGSDEVPGINGAIGSKRAGLDQIINTLNTSDIDETAMAVEENGGSIIKPRMAIPTVGWMIYFKDPEGNTHGAIQYDSSAK